jgi:hypothetical protein
MKIKPIRAMRALSGKKYNNEYGSKGSAGL